MKPVIPADSHVLEAPDTYAKRIDCRYKDIALRLGFNEKIGAVFDIHGIDKPLPLRLVSGAGKPVVDIEHRPISYDEIYRDGYDLEVRIGDQEGDGISLPKSFIRALAWSAASVPTLTIARPVSTPTICGCPSTTRRTRTFC